MFSTVAVGTDGSATATNAVEVGVEMARRFDAKLVLLSAYRDSAKGAGGSPVELQWKSSPAARIREILARTERRITGEGIECSTRVGEGDPGEMLVQLAEECGADVLVIGNKGMGRRVLGSVPNTVSHKAPCSVLVVKTT
jgi:nucleotide-binding universal stress UspA family protein